MANRMQKNDNADKDLTLRIKAMSDDELFDELKHLVNQSRFNGFYNRKLAVAVGKECRFRKDNNK
jgi:hypothetical protein